MQYLPGGDHLTTFIIFLFSVAFPNALFSLLLVQRRMKHRGSMTTCRSVRIFFNLKVRGVITIIVILFVIEIIGGTTTLLYHTRRGQAINDGSERHHRVRSAPYVGLFIRPKTLFLPYLILYFRLYIVL